MKTYITKLLVMVPVFILGLLSFSACSEEEGVVITIPETQSFNLNPGEEVELVFDAAADWKLASNKQWCKVKDNKVTGTAGKQVVTLQITNDELDFENETTAEVTLWIGEMSGVIAKVTRPVQTRKMEFIRSILEYDENKQDFVEVSTEPLNENGNIVLDYDLKTKSISFALVTVKANFDWEMSGLPAWLSVADADKVGKANQEKQIRFNFNIEHSRVDALDKSKVSFIAKGITETTYGFSFSYTGMPEEAIEFSEVAWDWVYSQNGAQHWTSNSGKMTGDLNLGITTKGGYKLYYFEKKPKENYTQKESVDWIELDETNKSNLVLKVKDNNSSAEEGTIDERYAIVLAVPNCINTQDGFNPETLFKDNELVDDQYLLISLKQQGNKDGGFDLVYSDFTLLPESWLEFGDPDDNSEVDGTKKVRTLTLPDNGEYNILVKWNYNDIDYDMAQIVFDNTPNGDSEDDKPTNDPDKEPQVDDNPDDDTQWGKDTPDDKSDDVKAENGIHPRLTIPANSGVGKTPMKIKVYGSIANQKHELGEPQLQGILFIKRK